MIKACLKRYGLWPVIVAVTLVSIVVSVAISAFIHFVLLNIEMTPVAVGISIACPLIIAPMMSASSFQLLLKLDRAHEDLRKLSNSDPLTGVYNRRYFMEKLHEEIERVGRYGTEFSVAFIDVDDFKGINDRHGHLSGDEMLMQLALTCMSQVRETDVFARIGGEEFALLLPHTSIAQALPLLERLREGVAALTVELPDKRLGVTVSIGLASPHGGRTDINGLLRRADEALYAAKSRGKNCVVLHSGEYFQVVSAS